MPSGILFTYFFKLPFMLHFSLDDCNSAGESTDSLGNSCVSQSYIVFIVGLYAGVLIFIWYKVVQTSLINFFLFSCLRL